MKRIEFLKRFVENGCYRYKRHIIDILSLRRSVEREASEANKFRISYLATGVFFIDPLNNYQLTKIEDAKSTEPLFKWSDRLVIDNSWAENVEGSIETSLI